MWQAVHSHHTNIRCLTMFCNYVTLINEPSHTYSGMYVFTKIQNSAHAGLEHPRRGIYFFLCSDCGASTIESVFVILSGIRYSHRTQITLVNGTKETE